MRRSRRDIFTVAVRRITAAIVVFGILAGTQPPARGQENPQAGLNVILGRPTDAAATLSLLSGDGGEARIGYGRTSGVLSSQSPIVGLKKDVPAEVTLSGLTPNARYYYRADFRRQGAADFKAGAEWTFLTQRAPGSTFTFDLQGDSHPERAGRMFDAGLYAQTLRNVAKDAPDFYVMMGDDFSLDHLMDRRITTLSQSAVDLIYARQRAYLDTVGRSSALFLVNGNHEHADRCLLDGTESNAAVMAGRARTHYFPLPAPDGFYTGDTEEVQYVGLPRDYYAWTWGDALFVVLDFYWHSPVQADSPPGPDRREKGGKKRDLWGVTLGDAQYQWLSRTLAGSKARWKFVFCHHVLGTGRGGVERAGLFEWGGRDERGAFAFAEKRPGWALPIHQLMARNSVTVFFQGHDHLYARQELDGVVYQSCPNPADAMYQAFNRDAYRSGNVLPNSGHLRVNVSPEKVTVEYVSAVLPKDANPDRRNAAVAYCYTIPAQGNAK